MKPAHQKASPSATVPRKTIKRCYSIIAVLVALLAVSLYVAVRPGDPSVAPPFSKRASKLSDGKSGSEGDIIKRLKKDVLNAGSVVDQPTGAPSSKTIEEALQQLLHCYLPEGEPSGCNVSSAEGRQALTRDGIQALGSWIQFHLKVLETSNVMDTILSLPEAERLSGERRDALRVFVHRKLEELSPKAMYWFQVGQNFLADFHSRLWQHGLFGGANATMSALASRHEMELRARVIPLVTELAMHLADFSFLLEDQELHVSFLIHAFYFHQLLQLHTMTAAVLEELIALRSTPFSDFRVQYTMALADRMASGSLQDRLTDSCGPESNVLSYLEKQLNITLAALSPMGSTVQLVRVLQQRAAALYAVSHCVLSGLRSPMVSVDEGGKIALWASELGEVLLRLFQLHGESCQGAPPFQDEHCVSFLNQHPNLASPHKRGGQFLQAIPVSVTQYSRWISRALDGISSQATSDGEHVTISLQEKLRAHLARYG